MGRFDDFELAVRKVRAYPLIYEVDVPSECSVFQDVRRYQSVTSQLDVRIVDINGSITLDQGMIPVPMAALPAKARNEFIDYLKLRVTRGDNIGSRWAFFRSESSKTITAFGANVVEKDALQGQERAIALMNELQRSGPKTTLLIKMLALVLILVLAAGGGYYIYQTFFAGDGSRPKVRTVDPESREMAFYQRVFPDVSAWQNSDKPDLRQIAEALIRPEYLTDILSCMDRDYYRTSPEDDKNFRWARLALFVYFNYNQAVSRALDRYAMKLDGTELARLARVYSTDASGYASNIFYFKVGDLNIRHPQITRFLNDNLVSYEDYERLRDPEEFARMLRADTIDFKLKNYLADVYTFTPLMIENPLEKMDWYLLTGIDDEGKIDFAAFFSRAESTLIPRRISAALMTGGSGKKRFAWYAINGDQQRALKLDEDANVYFARKVGQTFKLDLIDRKISELGLQAVDGGMDVTVHRELLMEDSKGKYGIQTRDPLTSLVLSNLISRSSFEQSTNVPLKRDPIQINTSLIQLSKDDGTSTQAVNISPGRSGILSLFRSVEWFRGKLANGRIVKFERADVNLFNPFSFMVLNDSITFGYRHEINQMTLEIDDKRLKIVKSSDGGYQIVTLD